MNDGLEMTEADIQRDPFKVAQEKLSRGQNLSDMDKTMLDRFAGNGDGVFDEKDIKKMEADRKDTTFLGGLERAGSALAVTAIAPELLHFSSVGGMEIQAPSISNPFTAAATGANLSDPAQQPAFNGPGVNAPGMTMGMNFSLRGLMGMA